MSTQFAKQLERDITAHKSAIALLKTELQKMTYRRKVIQHGLKQIRAIINEKETMLSEIEPATGEGSK